MTEAGGALHPGLRLVPATWSAPATGRRVGSPVRGAVPVHGQQRAIPDGGGAAPSGWPERPSTSSAPAATPSPCTPTRCASCASAASTSGTAARSTCDEFAGRRFDCVISLCDRVREVCPEFPGAPEVAHWSIADPAAEGTDDEQSYPAFERTAAELSTRIEFLLPAIDTTAPSKEGPDMTDTRLTWSTSATWSTTSTRRSTSTPRHLGFSVRTSFAPAFADVTRGNLRLLLSGPTSSAGRPMPDGASRTRAAGTASTSSSTTSPPRSSGCAAPGVTFRNDIVTGPGGRQILLEDPVGQRRRAVPARRPVTP